MLKAACVQQGVELHAIDEENFDYFDLPVLGENDLWYRIARGERARSVEKKLINENCGHFFTHWKTALSGRGDTFYYHEKAGISSVPTIPIVPRGRQEAARFAEELGGFPLIVKVTGGTKGVGVMRVDSQESLVSICDYLRATGVHVILRKYIEHTEYGRLIVLGDAVVASHRTKVLSGDFRSNTTDNIDENRDPYTFAPEIEEMAIGATHSVGLQFGGVDVLFDPSGNAYITEVNFPPQFSVTQRVTGIDIAGKMLQYGQAQLAQR